MKIPLQEKIAELESRIRDLEIEASNNSGFNPRHYSHSTVTTNPFGEHWRRMWKHFDKVMESLR